MRLSSIIALLEGIGNPEECVVSQIRLFGMKALELNLEKAVQSQVKVIFFNGTASFLCGH
jgi:hypothetical protein